MRHLRALVIAAGVLSAGFDLTTSRAASPAAPLTSVQAIELSGVQRRIDHFGADPEGQRLFVAALGNHTLEVLDVAGGKRITSIPNLNEPQGAAYLPSLHRIVVATRAGGTVTSFDDASYKPVATIPNLPDADNLRFDAATGQLYVRHGDGALGVIDPASMKLIADIPLPGTPGRSGWRKAVRASSSTCRRRERSWSSIEPSDRLSRTFGCLVPRTTTRCTSMSAGIVSSSG